MERDRKKRVREGVEDRNNNSSSSPEKHAKRIDDDPNYGNLDLKNKDDLEYNHNRRSSSTCSCCKTSDSHLAALGVFDFPWLKDGIISKSDQDWNFEDLFFSSTTPAADIEEFSLSGTSEQHCFYPTNYPPEALLLDFPEDSKVIEDQCINHQDDGLELESSEGADCIWTSLLNQPLQHPY